MLVRLGDDPSLLVDDAAVLEAVERLRAQGREARAIDLVRRLLVHRPDRLALHQRLAELLASRGDDAGAARLLEPFVDAPGAPLDLWMLAAEIAERRGDVTRALALYERVVARDLDYPRARARVRRLREDQRPTADVGATLLADGALTRGRYRVESELGRGGAGTVFLAEDLGLGRKVALKVYHRRGRAERERLLAEGRVPARFEHPGVVRVFDLDESLGAIAMERVLGGSVRQELRKGALPLARIQRWLITTAEVLAHVHAAGVVHRDLKPSNFLLRADDRVVLTDFGVACAAGHVPSAAEAGEGTLAYMPPEQRAGAAAHPSMDVYAFGVAMKEILGHAASAPPDLLGELAGACMRGDPRQRLTAEELLQRLSSP
jgi:serine/threonine-protein kinase